MLETLKKLFSEKESKHEELVSEYNTKIESKKKIESEVIEIEKQIIHNQGAMVAINEIAEQLMKDQEPQEVIASSAAAEIVTTEA